MFTGVSDRVVKGIVDRIFHEMYSSGATIQGMSSLRRLATTRELVKRRLIEAIYSRRDHVGARVECAQCLLEAGHLADARDALEFIALGAHEYHGDRIRAAELLLQIGREEIAREVLLEMADGADELWHQAEAATIVFASDRSKENYNLVEEVLRRQPGTRYDQVFESTLARLLAVGEKNLALPLLRGRVKHDKGAMELSGLGRDQIDACKSIAAFHDRVEAVEALKELFSSEHLSMRGKAEVLEGLADIGAEVEARQMLADMIGEGPAYEGADWFVLELLHRFALDKQLRCVGQYLLHVHLKRGQNYDFVEIVVRMAPHLEKAEVADLIRAKLRDGGEAQLAIALSIVGFRDEAIKLLDVWMKRGEIEEGVAAAKTLCVLGERQKGVRWLNRLVKSSTLDERHRMRAAEALQDANELSAAKKAFLILIGDRTIHTDERCRAARRICEEDDDAADAIWKIIFPELSDSNAQLSDRIALGEMLLDISLPKTEDFEYDDIIDELLEILSNENTSNSNAWNIVIILAEWLEFESIPRALSLADSDQIPIRKKIKGLEAAVRHRPTRFLAQKLVEMAARPEASYQDSISACVFIRGRGEGDRSREILDAIIRDEEVPPAWRLAAVSEKRGFSNAERCVIDELIIVRDGSVSIGVRLETLEKLEGLEPSERVKLLTEVAATVGLTKGERLSIAEAAYRSDASELGSRLAFEVFEEAPHSIYQAVRIAQLFRKEKKNDVVLSLVENIGALPDVVMREVEEWAPLIEAANIWHEVGCVEEARKMLCRVVEFSSWYNVDDVLDALEELFGADAARETTMRVLESKNDEGGEEIGYSIWAWVRLFGKAISRGWTTDMGQLHDVMRSPVVAMRDRISAASALYGNAAHDITRDWKATARGWLEACGDRIELSPGERLALIRELTACGSMGRARAQIERLIEASGLTAEEQCTLAGLLYESGDHGRARQVLDGIADRELARSYLGRSQERMIIHLLGDERLQAIKASRVSDDQDDIVDRLWGAQEAVSKYGDRVGLKLIFDTARDPREYINDRLHAIETLLGLGYRKVPTEILPEILSHPEVDHWWSGELLLNLGDTARALDLFRRAIQSAPRGYRDQIACRLAELQAVSLLEELNRTEGCSVH